MKCGWAPVGCQCSSGLWQPAIQCLYVAGRQILAGRGASRITTVGNSVSPPWWDWSPTHRHEYCRQIRFSAPRAMGHGAVYGLCTQLSVHRPCSRKVFEAQNAPEALTFSTIHLPHPTLEPIAIHFQSSSSNTTPLPSCAPAPVHSINRCKAPPSLPAPTPPASTAALLSDPSHCSLQSTANSRQAFASINPYPCPVSPLLAPTRTPEDPVKRNPPACEDHLGSAAVNDPTVCHSILEALFLM